MPRKPKVKRTDWEAACKAAELGWTNCARQKAADRAELLAAKSTLASLTDQIKAKGAKIADLAADLQATRDRDDELMAAQRERLIRLTEIKNSMAHFIQSYWEISEGTTAIELDGTMWMKFHHAENADHWVNNLEADIAALEVDSTLPAIPPKGTK